MRDPTLSEGAKETAARRASLALMGRFVSITVRTAIAVVVPLVVLAVLDAAGLVRRTAVMDFLTTWRGVILASVVTILICTVRARH
jgi:hypothetical protein